jgi:hypothetical protein
MRSHRLVLALAMTLAVSTVHQHVAAAEVHAAAYPFSGTVLHGCTLGITAASAECASLRLTRGSPGHEFR